MAVFGTQTAMLSLMDRDRVFVAAARGPFASAGVSCPWQWNFCGYSLLSPQPEVLVVGDALVDARCGPRRRVGLSRVCCRPRLPPVRGRAEGAGGWLLVHTRPLARSSKLGNPHKMAGLCRPCIGRPWRARPPRRRRAEADVRTRAGWRSTPWCRTRSASTPARRW